MTSICWNREGTQLLTGGTSITLWEYNLPTAPGMTTPFSEAELSRDEILEEEEEDEGLVLRGGGEGKKGEEESCGETEEKGVLKQLWRTDVPVLVRHLKFSPNADLFATSADVSATPLLICPFS